MSEGWRCPDLKKTPHSGFIEMAGSSARIVKRLAREVYSDASRVHNYTKRIHTGAVVPCAVVAIPVISVPGSSLRSLDQPQVVGGFVADVTVGPYGIDMVQDEVTHGHPDAASAVANCDCFC